MKFKPLFLILPFLIGCNETNNIKGNSKTETHTDTITTDTITEDKPKEDFTNVGKYNPLFDQFIPKSFNEEKEYIENIKNVEVYANRNEREPYFYDHIFEYTGNKNEPIAYGEFSSVYIYMSETHHELYINNQELLNKIVHLANDDSYIPYDENSPTFTSGCFRLGFGSSVPDKKDIQVIVFNNGYCKRTINDIVYISKEPIDVWEIKEYYYCNDSIFESYGGMKNGIEIYNDKESGYELAYCFYKDDIKKIVPASVEKKFHSIIGKFSTLNSYSFESYAGINMYLNTYTSDVIRFSILEIKENALSKTRETSFYITKEGTIYHPHDALINYDTQELYSFPFVFKSTFKINYDELEYFLNY